MGLLHWGVIVVATSSILGTSGKEYTLSITRISFLVTLFLLAFLVALCLLALIQNFLRSTFGWYASRGFSSFSRQDPGSWRCDKKINDSLFVWNKTEPPSSPELEILFFHGFHSSDSFDMHLRTWEALPEGGPCIWPSTWLLDSFPKARVFYVSYDAVLRKRSQRSFDLHNIAENLASDFIQAGIGQSPNCPVVLVGHCFGGIVIKQVCLHISRRISLEKTKNRKIEGENFLHSIKGIFYYGVPHRGSPCVDRAPDSHSNSSLEYFKLLSKQASRLNFDFALLHKAHGWHVQGLGEGIATNQGVFHGGIVAPEACAREGDEFYVVPLADHITITKPERQTDRRFCALTGLLVKILENNS